MLKMLNVLKFIARHVMHFHYQKGENNVMRTKLGPDPISAMNLKAAPCKQYTLQ